MPTSTQALRSPEQVAIWEAVIARIRNAPPPKQAFGHLQGPKGCFCINGVFADEAIRAGYAGSWEASHNSDELGIHAKEYDADEGFGLLFCVLPTALLNFVGLTYEESSRLATLNDGEVKSFPAFAALLQLALDENKLVSMLVNYYGEPYEEEEVQS